MPDVILHPFTERQLAVYSTQPAHAIILAGPTGSGKSTLGRHMIEQVLGLSAGGFDNYAYTLLVQPVETKAIGIEQVRQLERFVSRKVPATGAHHRAIMIEEAHMLTPEAQNALLKTLEEPPAGTIIVMTAQQEQALLPTIRSRAQTVQVKAPPRQAIEAYFGAQGHSSSQVQQAYRMSGGLPGLMHALLTDVDHPLVEATARARQLLGQSAYQRLLQVDELSKQKSLALDMLFILGQMAHISLQTASGPAAKRWQRIQHVSYETVQSLQASAQPKLALTQLMLAL